MWAAAVKYVGCCSLAGGGSSDPQTILAAIGKAGAELILQKAASGVPRDKKRARLWVRQRWMAGVAEFQKAYGNIPSLKASPQNNIYYMKCFMPCWTYEYGQHPFISMNWKGEPLVSFETVVNMISATKTKPGAAYQSGSRQEPYETGVKISKEQMKGLNLQRHHQNPE